MLGAGHSHTEPGRYQASIDRGLDWLAAASSSRAATCSSAAAATPGCTATRSPRWPSARPTACPGTRSSASRPQRAIDFIVLSQNQLDGGWRYQPGTPGDTSVFGWQMLCLRSASLAGLDRSPTAVVKGAEAYLDAAAADPDGSTYSYIDPAATPAR